MRQAGLRLRYVAYSIECVIALGNPALLLPDNDHKYYSASGHMRSCSLQTCHERTGPLVALSLLRLINVLKQLFIAERRVIDPDSCTRKAFADPLLISDA